MKTFHNVDTLLFDMDGTLTDLGKRWWDPFFRAYDKLRPDEDQIKKKEIFEKTLISIMETSMGSPKMLKIKTFWRASRDLKLSLIDTYRALEFLRKDPLAFKDIHPIDGVEEVLKTLQSRGYKMALVTSAGDDTVEKAKLKLKMLNSFDFIVTRNSVKRIKPYPDAILLASQKLGKNPSSCVMIGDFPQDVQAGKNAGTKTIAILGVNAKYTKERLIEQKPDALLSSIQELPDLFPSIN
ncbi:MAG: HAD family phosphatase [Candidatus Heimdallarchaeota archaeon]|nr:HAD family phosphatase [Candidatus Heimdallarchaeota archaeon]MCK4876213.1 HAD family phosphatase [Candidatus Heimdallarchaeota archaeon]